jgi:hypothetical protein
MQTDPRSTPTRKQRQEEALLVGQPAVLTAQLFRRDPAPGYAYAGSRVLAWLAIVRKLILKTQNGNEYQFV